MRKLPWKTFTVYFVAYFVVFAWAPSTRSCSSLLNIEACTAPQMIPRSEMIPKLDRKWSRTANDPRCGPQMIPPENEEWHGVWFPGFFYLLFYFYIYLFSSLNDELDIGMQSAVVFLSFAFFPRVRGKEMVNPQIKTWKSFLHLNSLIFVLGS